MNSTSSSPPLWVSMPIIRNIVLGATTQPQEIEQICAAGGLSVEALNSGDERVSLSQNCAIMEAAIHFSEDPSLGLHIGQRTTPVVLGIVGHIMESSSDVVSALKHLQDYTSAITRLYSFHVGIHENQLSYYCEPIELWNQISAETARHSVDIAFAGAINIIRLLTGKSIHPLEVNYRYDRPGVATAHAEILMVPPRFNSQVNRIVFDLADLQHPLLGFNKSLNATLRELVAAELDKNTGAATFSAEIRQVILRQYRFSIPQLEEVAAALHITPRTLQRKLQDEETSFRKLSESIRHELAIDLLRNHRLTIAEIGYMLGYAEPSAFQRAFRQWTNTTPQAFRDIELLS